MKTQKITRTAAALAILLALQLLTRSFGQLLTGSCVNCVLAVSALYLGWGSGLALALLSPILAWLLGVGPAFPALVPCIALGNAVYVLLLCRKWDLRWKLPLASAVKMLTLRILIGNFVAPLVVPAGKLIAVIAMFSWPQLVTALIGGALGAVVAKRIKKQGGTL